MAQHDYEIGNQSGSAFRTDLNNCLDAIQSSNSGSSEPSAKVAFQFWADTNANLLKIRNAANDGWITLFETDGDLPAKTFTGDVTLNAQSDLRFADSDSSNFVALQAPGTISTSYTLTLPDADGSADEVLKTDGSGNLSFGAASGGDISSTAPERTFTNTTHEDTDGGRESKITFKGEQSGGEVSTLAQIEASHDGSSDDEKGQIKFKINDGNDGSSPGSALTINSSHRVGIGTESPTNPLHIRKDASGDTTFLRMENLQNAGGAACGINLHFEIDNSNASNPQGQIAYLENGNDAYGDFIFRSTPQSNTTTMEDRHKMTANGTYVWAGRDCTTDFTSALNAYEFRLNTGHHSNVGTMMLRSEDQLNLAGDQVRFVVSDDNRSFVCGVLKSAAGNKCGFVNMVTDDGQNGFLFVDNSDVLRISNTSSVVGSTGGTVVGSQTSDSRLKNSITDYAGGLDLVTQLRPVNFKYNKDADGLLHAGFIAQEVQSIIPEAVYDTKNFLELRDENGDVVKRKPQDDEGNEIPDVDPEMVFQEEEPTILAMDYVEIIPALVNSIKELKTQNEALIARVAALEAA